MRWTWCSTSRALAWPYLKASRGVIVITASVTALMGFKTLGSLAHTAAKAGIIGMTRQLPMEGRTHGIRANSISPGVIPQRSSYAITHSLFTSPALTPSPKATRRPGSHVLDKS
jgi:NAD(P)-dependent dehydrogenase (short-subunit alcohol dehydrogenase family)